MSYTFPHKTSSSFQKLSWPVDGRSTFVVSKTSSFDRFSIEERFFGNDNTDVSTSLYLSIFIFFFLFSSPSFFLFSLSFFLSFLSIFLSIFPLFISLSTYLPFHSLTLSIIIYFLLLSTLSLFLFIYICFFLSLLFFLFLSFHPHLFLFFVFIYISSFFFLFLFCSVSTSKNCPELSFVKFSKNSQMLFDFFTIWLHRRFFSFSNKKISRSADKVSTGKKYYAALVQRPIVQEMIEIVHGAL